MWSQIRIRGIQCLPQKIQRVVEHGWAAGGTVMTTSHRVCWIKQESITTDRTKKESSPRETEHHEDHILVNKSINTNSMIINCKGKSAHVVQYYNLHNVVAEKKIMLPHCSIKRDKWLSLCSSPTDTLWFSLYCHDYQCVWKVFTGMGLSVKPVWFVILAEKKKYSDKNKPWIEDLRCVF